MLNQAVFYLNSDKTSDEEKKNMVSSLNAILKDPASINSKVAAKKVTMQDFNPELLVANPLSSSVKSMLSDFFSNYLRQEVASAKNSANYTDVKLKMENQKLRSQTEIIPDLDNGLLMKYFKHSGENKHYFNSKVLFVLQNLSYLQIMHVTWALIRFNENWIENHHKESNTQFYSDEYIATRALLRTSTNTELVFERLAQLKAQKLKFNPEIKTVGTYKNLKDKFQVTLLSYIIQVWPEIKTGISNASDDAHQMQLSATIATICFRALLKFIIEKSFTSWWISNGKPSLAEANFGLNGKLNILIAKNYRSNWVTYLKINKPKEMAFIMVHCDYLKTTPLYGNFLKWVDDHEDTTISSKLQVYYENLLRDLAQEPDSDAVIEPKLQKE